MLDRIGVEYLDGCTLRSFDRAPETLAEFSHSYADDTARLGWFLPITNPRTYALEITGLPTQVAPSESPLLTLTEPVRLRVDYDQPVGHDLVTTDEVLLVPCRDLEPAPYGFQTRTLSDDSNVEIVTRFWWPYWPSMAGSSIYSTAPAVFEETVITGLTAAPITLSGRYSQSYRPFRHNGFEFFLFDPFLDPQVPTDQLQELEEKGIRQIVRADISTVLGDSDGCGEQVPPRRPRARHE